MFLVRPVLPDEGQAWLWALEINNPLTFLAVPGEGHPPLWFLTLKLLSAVLDYTQVRWLTPVLTLINGLFILRLFRQQSWLALVLLLSGITFLFWGILFRPYTAILTLLLLALLAEQGGHWRRAGWLLAIATGFHFYANALFGFWLLVSLVRQRDWRHLLGPAVLAALFALSAIVSGQGNAANSLHWDTLVALIFDHLIGGFGMAAPFAPLIAALLAAWLVLSFRSDLPVLMVLLVTMTGFSTFTALVYGYEPWHLAFISALLVMAAIMARPAPDDWRIAILLLPWVWGGVYATIGTFNAPPDGLSAAYQTIANEAETEGTPIGPDTLIVWPDYLFVGQSALHDFRYTSGNNGAELGPVNWRARANGDISETAFRAHPAYLLVCAACELLAPSLEAANATTENVLTASLQDGQPLKVYRVTLPDQSASGE